MASSTRRTFVEDKNGFTADAKSCGLATVPAEALRFDAGPFAFAAVADDEKGGDRPITMLARTAEPIEHWYWGKVVHDMAGMKLSAPTLPCDYCHDPAEVLGFLDKFDAGNEGLKVSGKIVSFQPDDRAAEVVHKADAGVPYQSSIYFDPNSVIVEDVGPNQQVTVNGYQLVGPALVLRQWTLRGVSVCPYGADAGTSTQFNAAHAADVSIKFVTPKEDAAAMSATPNTEAKTETKTAGELAAETKPATPETIVIDLNLARSEFAATIKKFTEKFGAENGAKWAVEGLSYEAALEKHAAELAASNKTLSEAKTALETKLAAVPRGEQEPVSFSTTEKHEGSEKVPAKFAGLGKLGAFAANLKIPGQPVK